MTGFRMFLVLSVLMRLDMLMGRDSCLGEPPCWELDGVCNPSGDGESLLLWLLSSVEAFRTIVK